MRIESQNTPATSGLALKREPANVALEVSNESELVNDDAAIVDASPEKQRGVISNVLEGQFKGIANARLRINFSDELQGLEQQIAAPPVRPNTDKLLEGVNSAFSVFVENEELSEDSAQELDSLRIGFQEQVTKLFTSSAASDLPSAIRTEGDSLIAALRLSLKPDADEAEPTADKEFKPSNAEILISSLTELFERASSSLEETEVSSLLSEPSGEGGAYEKFLSIYSSLLKSRTQNKEPASTFSIVS